jgi:hypothetical protein
MDIQTLEKDNADLQKQNRKRTFVIVGFMVAGAVGGFVLARGMKGKTLAKVGATIGGSLLLGLPILLATRKKAKERSVKIELNKKQIEALKAGTPVSNTVNAVVDGITNVITNAITPKNVSTVTQPGSGVLTIEQQNKNKAAGVIPGVPNGKVQLNTIS